MRSGSKRGELDPGEWFAAPPGERGGQGRRANRRITGPSRLDVMRECHGIDGGAAEGIAVGVRHDVLRAERGAQLEDVLLQDLAGRRRRSPLPQVVDEALGRHELRPADDEEGEELTLLRRERDDSAGPMDLDGPEHPHVQQRHRPRALRPGHDTCSMRPAKAVKRAKLCVGETQ